MVPAVWSKAGAGGKLLLDAAVHPRGEVQLDVEPEREINISSGMKIADIYISISTGTFDIENIKYEKKWQQLDLDTNFEP